MCEIIITFARTSRVLQGFKERWQSGRLWRSRKPLRVTPPGVRIPPSPLVTLKISNLTNKYPKKYPKWAFWVLFFIGAYFLCQYRRKKKNSPTQTAANAP